MRVEIKLRADLLKPYAVIHAAEVSDEVQQAVRLLEGTSAGIITARKQDTIFLVERDNIQIIRTENGEVALYDHNIEPMIMNMRLYEIEAILGNDFVRISKGAIVNLKKIDHVDMSFGGMSVILKNGMEEFISRRFLADFKKRLGL